MSCLWLQILADVQVQKWTNSRRAKLRDHICVLCTFSHHAGAQMSSQEHPLGQWAASHKCCSQDSTQTQHTELFWGGFKHRAGNRGLPVTPTDASNPQLLTWFYSHSTLERKENFIPVVLETEPRIETRFAEYHLNTLSCLLFVSFDGIPAAVPKPGLKQNPLFPSCFPAEQTQKRDNPPSVLSSASQVCQLWDFSVQLNKTRVSPGKKTRNAGNYSILKG